MTPKRPKKDMGRKTLRKKIDEYFDSIRRTVPAMEQYDTGEVTEKGAPIYGTRPIKNDAGEDIKILEYISPPSLSALCLFLGISRQTWSEYCMDEELSGETEAVRIQIEAYLEEQLVSRQKAVDGIKFNLIQNFGWTDKKEPELGTCAEHELSISELSLSEKIEMLEKIRRGFYFSETNETTVSGKVGEPDENTITPDTGI